MKLNIKLEIDDLTYGLTLHLKDKVEVDSYSGQPARNDLSDWNEKWGLTSPRLPLFIPGEYIFENALT